MDTDDRIDNKNDVRVASSETLPAVLLSHEGNTDVEVDEKELDMEEKDSLVSISHEQRLEQKEMIRNRVRRASAQNALFIPAKPKPTVNDDSNKRVAVYARVSTDSLQQTSSIENQTRYYTEKIEKHPNWEMQQLYSDEGKSGTSMKHRYAFNQMMTDASEGKMDLILCASVSRFARNMSDCLTQIRLLRTMHPNHPVGVFFETEQIYTLNSDSDQALKIHAMLADWESANRSQRMILSYDQRICTGQYLVADLLGYRHTKEGELIVVPEEAKTVRFIYLAYINGYSAGAIADVLTEMKRPTLRGRVNWNGQMVCSVMSNERRWGALYARKTIVLDCISKKNVRNNRIRDAAFVQAHHLGIVSPEIAKAARLLASSSRSLEGGVPIISVIREGTLKGFVSVCPAWYGADSTTFQSVCRSVYAEEELLDLERAMRIEESEEHSNVLSQRLTGYQVPHGIYFLNNRSPAMTIAQKGIEFTKACHERLGNCKRAEILYHPILQMIAVRACSDDCENGIVWERKNGNTVTKLVATAFAQAVYEKMNWIINYRFRFRGVTRVRGNARIILFSLDEPQILTDKKHTDATDQEGGPVRYIAYKNPDKPNAMQSDVQETQESSGSLLAYPYEWVLNHIGMSYKMQRRRDWISETITEEDIAQNGVEVANPMIGMLPRDYRSTMN